MKGTRRGSVGVGAILLALSTVEIGANLFLPRLSSAQSLVSMKRQPTPEFVPGKILVGLDATGSEADVDSILSKIRAKKLISHPKIRMLVLSVPVGTEMSAIAKLSGGPHIRYAEPDYILHLHDLPTPDDSLFAQQWNLAIIQAPTSSLMAVKRSWEDAASINWRIVSCWR